MFIYVVHIFGTKRNLNILVIFQVCWVLWMYLLL